MTRVQIAFELERPLDAEALRRLESAYGVYGIGRIEPSPDLRRLVVDYDASRLSAAEVESVLRRLDAPIAAVG
jgi:allophanate hydrolase subunit 1